MMRAWMSGVPPAADGTTRRIGLPGYPWPNAADATASRIAGASNNRLIGHSPGVGSSTGTAEGTMRYPPKVRQWQNLLLGPRVSRPRGGSFHHDDTISSERTIHAYARARSARGRRGSRRE